MSRRPRLWLAALSAGAMVIGGAALAWACTPQAYITLSPTKGGPGTSVTVSGKSFVNNGRVEIRWGSSSGMLLREASGPNFTVAITIPQSEPAVYSVVAIGYDTAGIENGRTAAPFEVTGTQSGGGGSGGGGTAENSSGSTSGGGQSGGSGGGETSQSTSGGGGSPSGGGGGSNTSTSGGSGGSDDGGSGGQQGGGAPPPGGDPGTGFPAQGGSSTGPRPTWQAAPASAQPAAVKSASGQVFFGGSVASRPTGTAATATGSDAAAGGTARAEKSSAGGVSEASAGGDVWGAVDREAPSLASDVSMHGAEAPADPYPAIGLALLGFGLVGLFGGALTAAVAGRRATARVRTGR